jgi:hypothetical protein
LLKSHSQGEAGYEGHGLQGRGCCWRVTVQGQAQERAQERITSIGPAAGSTVPAGTPLIDLSGKTVLPGLAIRAGEVKDGGDPGAAPVDRIRTPREA